VQQWGQRPPPQLSTGAPSSTLVAIVTVAKVRARARDSGEGKDIGLGNMLVGNERGQRWGVVGTVN
jgi:hypothetical protein